MSAEDKMDDVLPTGWEIFTSERQRPGSPYYFNTLTGKTQWKEPAEALHVLPLVQGWVAVLSSVTGQGKGQPFYQQTETGELQWERPQAEQLSCDKTTGLVWTRNSCYIDSPLQALLANPSPLGDYILGAQLKARSGGNCGDDEDADLRVRERVQNNLEAIAKVIRGAESRPRTADNLRRTLSQCRSEENWNNSQMRDAGEFLQFLFALFPGMDQGQSSRTTIGYSEAYPDGRQTSKSVTKDASPIALIFAEDVEAGTPLSDLTETVEDSGELEQENLYRAENEKGEGVYFSRRVSTTKIEHVPGALIFYVQRGQAAAENIADAVEEFDDRELNIDEAFALGSQTLSLSAIVVFHGAHYTCYFLCGETWFFYDDTEENMVAEIGGFEELLRHNDGAIATHGVMYFYNVTAGPTHLGEASAMMEGDVIEES